MIEKDVIGKFKRAQESLVVQHSDFSLSTIYDMVRNASIDLDPHYQRRERWSTQKQSALIESFIINVPVPPVYLSEDDYGVYSVIDGKQRITAIRDFISGDLKLKSLKDLPELDGMTFEELPAPIRNALSIRPYIRVITLLRQSDPELKYEVFLRLNTGGEKLKPQEIRNVAYSGPLNDLLYELSENPILKEKLRISSQSSNAFRNMDDLEHVLRFFTLYERWEKMGKVLSIEMDSYMAENRKLPKEKIDTLRETFNRCINGCVDLWGEFAFYKPLNQAWRDQFISPLFDAEMVAVSQLTAAELTVLRGKREMIVAGTRRLFEHDAEFSKSINQATNNPANVTKRINSMHGLLDNLLKE